MNIFRKTVGTVATLLCFAVVSSGFSQQVIINEVSTVQNDRLLQRPPGMSPRLGNLPAWHELDFAVPSFWKSGTGPYGFGYSVSTNVSAAMLNKAPSLYLRRPFQVTAAQATNGAQLELLINYDDGFVAYLNGVEVARRNTGAAGSYTWHDQAAFNTKQAGATETIALGVASALLREGGNVLAIQVHNSALNNGQFYCAATLRIGGAAPQNLVVPSDVWSWFAGTHAPSGGLYDASDFSAALPLAPEFLDWIELRNVSASVVNLGGWTVTDSRETPAKWTFPSGITIPAGGYLVVACSGRDVRAPANGGLLHTNFSLNSKGEYLALRDGGGVVHSELAGVPAQNAFHTWGVDAGSGQYRFLSRGTPGAPNAGGSANRMAAEVDFDKQTGFHASPLTVALSTATPAATIRYTLDGSEPSESSVLYTGPFNPMNRPSEGPGAGTILREMFQWSSGTVVRPASLPANATPTSTQLISSWRHRPTPVITTPSVCAVSFMHRRQGVMNSGSRAMMMESCGSVRIAPPPINAGFPISQGGRPRAPGPHTLPRNPFPSPWSRGRLTTSRYFTARVVVAITWPLAGVARGCLAGSMLWRAGIFRLLPLYRREQRPRQEPLRCARALSLRLFAGRGEDSKLRHRL